MNRSLTLAVTLFALAAAPAARAASAPALTIEVATRRPAQGAVVPLLVRSDRPLEALALRLGDGREVRLEAFDGGTLFRGLIGVDLDAAVGTLPLRLATAGQEGPRAPVTGTIEVAPGGFPVRRLRVDGRYVELPPGVLDRVRAERRAVAAVWASGDPERRWAGSFRRPVDARPSGNFGVRRFFNGQPRSPHNGVDFPAPHGASVVAPAAARVALAGDLYFSGWSVILDHGRGLFTTYFHLSRIDVAVEELVEPGQPIGAVGATGRVTGPHLHWGARLHGARVNPLDLLALPEWPPAATRP